MDPLFRIGSFVTICRSNFGVRSGSFSTFSISHTCDCNLLADFSHPLYSTLFTTVSIRRRDAATNDRDSHVVGKHLDFAMVSQDSFRTLASYLSLLLSHARPLLTATSNSYSLNKIDLLKEKILADPDSVQHFLPEYTGSPTDVDSVKMYLLSRFKALHRMQERVLFVHFTCATDTTAIRPILSAVIEAVVTASLTHLGIL